MLISIPTFEEISRVLSFQEDVKYKASYEYTLILSDAQTKSETFISLFTKVRTMMKENKRETEKPFKQYTEKLCKRLYSVHPDIELSRGHLHRHSGIDTEELYPLDTRFPDRQLRHDGSQLPLSGLSGDRYFPVGMVCPQHSERRYRTRGYENPLCHLPSSGAH